MTGFPLCQRHPVPPHSSNFDFVFFLFFSTSASAYPSVFPKKEGGRGCGKNGDEWLSIMAVPGSSKVGRKVRIGKDLGSTLMTIGFLKQRERKKGIPY